MSSNNVAKNETGKTVENTLRSFDVFTFCPNCRKGVATKTEKNMHIVNLLCCIFCNGCWFARQMCNVKDINCYDAHHTCTSCNTKLGTYTAC